MIIDVPRIYDRLVKDGKQRSELISQIRKDPDRTYKQGYGFSEAILTKKWFRYPSDNVSLRDLRTKKNIVSQQNCFESGLENYFLVLAEGYSPEFYDCFFEKEGNIPHALVLYKKNEKQYARDTFYCRSGPAKVYDKNDEKYLRVGNREYALSSDPVKRDIKSVLWDIECYRRYDGIVNMLATNQTVIKKDFFKKVLVTNLKYEPEKKKLIFSIDIYFQGKLLGRINSTGIVNETNNKRIFRDFSFYDNKFNIGWGKDFNTNPQFKFNIDALDEKGSGNVFLKKYEKVTEEYRGQTECFDRRDDCMDQSMRWQYYFFELCKSGKDYLHSKDKIIAYIENSKSDYEKIKKIFDKVDKIRNKRLAWEKNQYNQPGFDVFKFHSEMIDDSRADLDTNYHILLERVKSKESLSEVYNKAKTKGERERIIKVVDIIMTSPLRKDLYEEMGENPMADVFKNREKRIAAIGLKRGLDKKRMLDDTYLDVMKNMDSFLYLPEKAGQIIKRINLRALNH